jgi:hypothetical protein
MGTSIETLQSAPASHNGVPSLYNGDHLTRPEFERRYAAMPDVKKAELIEGVVYMPSPVSDEHSGSHFDWIGWLSIYKAATPGISGGDNGSLRLDLKNAPQPDSFLRILSSHGGQAVVDKDGYVTGAPEWLGEIAVSSASIDLHAKLRAYERNKAREYAVWRVEDRAIDWFVLRDGKFERLHPDATGIYRSEVLPGLWLDTEAMLRGDLLHVFEVVRQGMASSEYGAFKAKLQETAAKGRT